MSLTVAIWGSGGDVRQVAAGGSVADVLRGLDVSPQEYLVAVGDALVPSDAIPEDGDELVLIRVVKGG